LLVLWLFIVIVLSRAAALLISVKFRLYLGFQGLFQLLELGTVSDKLPNIEQSCLDALLAEFL
jgi:hypothetical protein